MNCTQKEEEFPKLMLVSGSLSLYADIPVSFWLYACVTNLILQKPQIDKYFHSPPNTESRRGHGRRKKAILAGLPQNLVCFNWFALEFIDFILSTVAARWTAKNPEKPQASPPQLELIMGASASPTPDPWPLLSPNICICFVRANLHVRVC